jgi:hypothetical protein
MTLARPAGDLQQHMGTFLHPSAFAFLLSVWQVDALPLLAIALAGMGGPEPVLKMAKFSSSLQIP